jgi:hypothetical protein
MPDAETSAPHDRIGVLRAAWSTVRATDVAFQQAVHTALRGTSPDALRRVDDVTWAIEIPADTTVSGRSWRAEPGMIGRDDEGVTVHSDHDPGERNQYADDGPVSSLSHVPLAALDAPAHLVEDVRRTAGDVVAARAALRSAVRSAISDLDLWVSTGPDATEIVVADDSAGGFTWRVTITVLPDDDQPGGRPGVNVYIDDATDALVGLSIFRLP